jgi:hypothetical protein
MGFTIAFLLSVILVAVQTAAPVSGTSSPSSGESPAAGRDGTGSSATSILGPLRADPSFADDVSVDRIRAGPEGFIASGHATHPRDAYLLGGVAWLSPDGSTWERVDSPVLDGQPSIKVEPGGPGWVAIGSDGLAAASADGRTWERADDRTGQRQRWRVVQSLTHLKDGSVLVFGYARGRNGVWRSSDGLRWQELDGHLGQPGRAKPRGRPRILDAVSFGDGWIATKSEVVLVSRDGHRWREFPAPAQLESIAVVGHHIVGLSRDGATAGLWSSEDGEAWLALGMPRLDRGFRGLVALTASAGRFVLVGARGGGTWQDCWGEVTDRAFGVWTSADGSSWERLPVDLPAHFRFAGVAATDDEVILVGHERLEDWTLRPVAVRTPAGSVQGAEEPGVRPAHWVPPPELAWSEVVRVRVPAAAGMTRLLDGRLLFAGSKRLSRLAIIVDPETGKRQKVGPLPEPAIAPVLTTAPDGRVYLLPHDGRIQRFDPDTSRWRLLKTHTRRALSATDPPPTVSSAAWMADGRLLIASWPPMDRPGQPRLQVFDPRSDRIRPMPFPAGSRGQTVATTASGETLVFTQSRAWRNAPGDGWIAGASNPHFGEPFFGAIPVPLADGRVAVLVPDVHRVDITAHEMDYCAPNEEEVTLLDVYDPDADAWSTLGAFPRLRLQSDGAVQLGDGRLLINDATLGLITAELPSAVRAEAQRLGMGDGTCGITGAARR